MARGVFNYCIYGVLFFLLFAVSSAQEESDSTFKVTSFIPERFSDLELKVEGEWNSTDVMRHGFKNFRQYSDRDYDSYIHQDEALLRSNLVLNYRFWSIQNQLDYHLSFRFDNTNYDVNDSVNNSQDNVFSFNRNHNAERDDVSLSLDQSLSGEQYIKNNLFVGGTGRLMTSYSDNESISWQYDTGFDTYGNGSLRELESIVEMGQFNEYRSYRIGVEVFTGLGRIYEGYFAARALYLIDELGKMGYLLQEPNYEQLIELSKLIYYYDQKHVIDLRIRRIDAVTSIIEYLHKEGLLADTSITAAVYIHDIYEFYPNERRNFGSKLSLGTGIENDFNSRHERNFNNLDATINYYDNSGALDSIGHTVNNKLEKIYSKETTHQLYIFIKYEYGKAYNIHWQGNLSLDMRYYFSNRKTDESWHSYFVTGEHVYSKREYLKDISFQSILKCNFLYIINSRSSLVFRYDLALDGWKEKYYTFPGGLTHLADERTFAAFTSIPLINFNYRLAVPTTLSIGASYIIRATANQHFDNDIDYNIESRARFAISISHYIY